MSDGKQGFSYNPRTRSTQCNANPYILRLDSLDALNQHPEPEGQAKPLCELSTIITFDPDNMLMHIATAFLRSWASQVQTKQQQKWMEDFCMTKFQEHFTAADDWPLLEAEDLDFDYYGDGIFEPGSQQGLIGKAPAYTDDLRLRETVTCMFDIDEDGSMHQLHIHYSGTYKYKLKTVQQHGSFDDSSSASDTNPTPPMTESY